MAQWQRTRLWLWRLWVRIPLATPPNTMRNLRYKNIILFLISLGLAIFLVREGLTNLLAEKIGQWGYLGSYFLGIMFSSSLTVGVAVVFIYSLGQELNPVLVVIFAALGSVTGDFIFYKVIKDQLLDELKEIYAKISLFPKKQLKIILENKYFAWFVPSVAYLIILTPIPDEVGIGMLSSIRYSVKKLLILTFILHLIGISLVVILGIAMR